MSRFHSRTFRLRRRALGVLLSFVAALVVMVATPFVESAQAAPDFDFVCSVHGDKRVTHDDDGRHSEHADHAAHCPLCMPVGAPPSAIDWDFESVQPLAHVRRAIPAARLASLVGAPLPARGPPSAS